MKEDFNEDGLEKVKGQGLSYVRYLHSHYLGLADKYSFMLFERREDDTYDLDNPIINEQWRAIYSDADLFAKITNILHPERIKMLN